MIQVGLEFILHVVLEISFTYRFTLDEFNMTTKDSKILLNISSDVIIEYRAYTKNS